MACRIMKEEMKRVIKLGMIFADNNMSGSLSSCVDIEPDSLTKEVVNFIEEY
jgi:hypothetical protein